MKPLIFLAAAMITAPVFSFELIGLSLKDIQGSNAVMAEPVPEMVPGSEDALDGQFISDKSAPFYTVTTARTNVCSDGQKLSAADKKPWVEYQRKNGFETAWKDDSHQDETATGKVNAIEVPYVVVPRNHRELLRKKAEVCVVATGKCVKAEVREIGPAFGEVSVAVMMGLGLNAHPDYGRHNGKVTYKFYK
ncbi:MAG: hypothetical protein COX65_05525 [Elusimicrobia bacterium CG_4_10_14_0_2_um_filter_56_8]|nr:MAG: hypothetical protein AUJ51_07905 [Elusimicrobia bacterium CG1_02_56_21]PJA14544.1 MAG: hypothetical protein COX65_05525 [Elusimicrobia bacterium CG_4_10_14_0_2_um_filter_56_8]